MKRLIILGVSGSIGMQTVNVVTHHRDEFMIVGVSVAHQIEKLKEIMQACPTIRYICVAHKQDMLALQKEYPSCQFFCGEDGLSELAGVQEYDMLVNAVVGFRGMLPTLTAIENHKAIALANKETLVAGGAIIKQALQKHKVPFYPIDSEHSAIFQCLQGNQWKTIDKLIITASGGSFREKTREQLHGVSVAQALAHPNWKMGGRITIDSATMMNKGFEVIEAHYLFDIPYEQIEVVLHQESVIHSMVQYQDHAIMAQLGTADMRLPIQYALAYPNRLPMYDAKAFNFLNYPQLHFAPIDFKRYPLLQVAYEVGKKGGNLGAVMNAADEEAVALFLQEKISFLDIETYVIEAVQQAVFIAHPQLQELLESDRLARDFVKQKWEGVRQ